MYRCGEKEGLFGLDNDVYSVLHLRLYKVNISRVEK